MRRFLMILAGLVAGASGGAQALDGELDPAFGGSPFPGTLTVSFDRANSTFDDRGWVSVATAQGLVIAGSVAASGGGTDIGVIRLTYAGQLDTTFGTQGRTLVPIDLVAGGIDRPGSITTDPVGRFVIGAAASTAKGVAPVVVRLTADGLLDAGFAGTGTRVVEDLAVAEFRSGALALAGPDSSVYFAAVARSNQLGALPAFYVSRWPATGLGGPQLGGGGRTFIGLGNQLATSAGAFVLRGSTLMLCGGVASGSSARWAFATLGLDGGAAAGVALDASQTPSVNAGDHVCKAIVPSRFDPARIYLGGGGLVGGKNGVVVAAVNFGGVPDSAFGGGGFARLLVSPTQTYSTLGGLVERESGRIALAGSLDRPGTGTDAYTATLDTSGALDRGGVTIFELLEDSRQSRVTALHERGGRLYLTGLLQYGPGDPGDFDFLAMKTLAGATVFGHGFE